MSVKEYRGVKLYSGDCPNGCFHKLIDRAIAENTVGRIEPEVAQYSNFGIIGFQAKRYSTKLKRHTKTVNGHYAYAHWAHCPICGAKLEATNHA